ncbi:hypothetical protein DV737_g3488, partial [Chaetothyriales sp. CBS 132003]
MAPSDAVTTRSGVRASSLIGTAFITTITYLAFRYLHTRTRNTKSVEDGTSFAENPIVKNFSALKSYRSDRFYYPSIRTFYHPHRHRQKLQAIAELPLLVFVHGLGGSLEQFGPLLGSLINVGPCFGIELPGHGKSAFEPHDYEAYTVDAFVHLWRTAIASVCREYGHKSVVLLGHSMGCSISALLATQECPDFEVAGMIAICPKANPPTQAQTKQFRRFLSLPDFVLDTFRFVDKIGGVDSKSVKRFVGEHADVSLRKAQLYFNEQFKTPVWKRAAIGCLATYDSQGQPHGGMPGKDTWSKVETPLFLVAGEADSVTKPEEVEHIVSYLRHRKPPSSPKVNVSLKPMIQSESERPTPASSALAPTPYSSFTTPLDASDKPAGQSDQLSSDKIHGTRPAVTEEKSLHSVTIKTVILPSPAAHALLYDPAVYRTLAGLIEDFLRDCVSPHLDLGWQLQSLTTTGKWDVKNLEKWQATLPVSGPICTKAPPPNHTNGLFRALKTLREQDSIHTPKRFIANWKDKIYAIIDISHDPPIYDTKAMDRGGIHYHKFPTVSKVPPTVIEVGKFIALVDRIRNNMAADGETYKSIGVHCHYGYNRTGFFICSYLIEREDFSVEEAVDEFKQAKPPGIKHDHFIDTLYVRYCVGLKKPATLRLEEDSEG